jgi:uncharacterized protein (DUF4415 family)
MSANKQRLKSNLKKVDAYVIRSEEYDEAPEWTADDFAQAVVKKRGRPATGHTKTQVTLRLDNDLLASYRSTGEGWQTLINDDLRKIRNIA